VRSATDADRSTCQRFCFANNLSSHINPVGYILHRVTAAACYPISFMHQRICAMPTREVKILREIPAIRRKHRWMNVAEKESVY
jgi:hypothetical protein